MTEKKDAGKGFGERGGRLLAMRVGAGVAAKALWEGGLALVDLWSRWCA